MRTRKLLCTVACLAFLAAGVSCNKEAPGAAGEMPEQVGQDGKLCTATFRLNLDGMSTKSATTGSVTEDAIRRIDVFEYDLYSSVGRLNNHYTLTAAELSAGEFHLQYSYGTYYAYLIVANMPQAIVDDILLCQVSWFSNSYYKWADLYDGSYFPMSAGVEVEYYNDVTVDVNLRRFMYRVDVGEIRVNFDEASWMNKDVFVKSIALTNVANGWSYTYNLHYAYQLYTDGYLYGSTVSTTEDKPFFGGLLSGYKGAVASDAKSSYSTYRYSTETFDSFPCCLNVNYMVNAGLMPITATGALLDATYQSYSGEAGRVASSTNPSQSHTLTVNKSFYALAGGSIQGTYGLLQYSSNQNAYPKLVVELEIDGETHYYPVQMYYPQSNTVYQVNRITIKSAGSEYSNFFEKLVHMEMDINVLDWTEVAINNIDTGFTDEHHTEIYN